MRKNIFLLLLTLSLTLGSSLFGQGINTPASKDDWEEINFETNSDILVDGFPSLLRMADSLSRHPDYKAQVIGHGDGTGSAAAAEKLGMRRAQAIKDFLVKYGAKPEQVEISSAGNRDPKVDGRTKEGAFMNRRATTRLLDGQGRPVPACPCDEVKPLQDENARLRQNNADLENRNRQLQQQLDDANRRATAAQAAQQEAASRANAAAQAARDAAAAAQRDVDAAKAAATVAPPPPAPAPTKLPLFSLLGLNVGADQNGGATMTGSGRFFAPFHKTAAAQIQGEYMYFGDRREAQADIGLVNRWNDFQLGGFASFRNVSMKNMQNSGTMGQASFLADYLFPLGKVGIYGSKTFLNDPIINRVNSYMTPSGTVINSPFLFTETYLHAVDSLGATGAIAIGKSNKSPWIDGNIGWLKSAAGNTKAGGTGRLVFPVASMLALTGEMGVNESLVSASNPYRVVFGILFGRQTHPNEYRSVEHPVPMMAPRIRYEMATRVVRTGNSAPVADAGPNQTGVAAGTIRLDGSKSYDPEGDPLTYQWVQTSGPTVALSAPTAVATTFAAIAGQTYTFRLTVSDGQANSSATVSVSAKENPKVRIVRFTASPTSINAGGTSVLNWLVENADTVTISGVSQSLNKENGTVNVTPSMTTTYILTATNAFGSETATASVTVGSTGNTGNKPVVVSFVGQPSEILEGASSTLSWNVTGATKVVIDNGIGTVPASGSTPVTPAVNTTYRLTATNDAGDTIASTTISVYKRVKITSFTASPNRLTAAPGLSSTFTWTTENATGVTITPGGGDRAANGSTTLAVPGQTTTFTLTAVGPGPNNTATATTTITVDPAPGTTPTGPVAGVAYDNFYTAFRVVQLDGRPSVDPEGGALTYQWTSSDGKGEVLSPASALTQVRLKDGFYGDFYFQLTVTDSKGRSSSKRVRVIFRPDGLGVGNQQ